MDAVVEVNCDVCGCKDSEELLSMKGSAYHHCNQCGMIYAKWIPEEYEQVNEEAFAAKLENYAAKVEQKGKAYRKKLRFFDRYKTDGKFLEIGCSAGAVLVAARANGWDVSGVDISSTVSRYALENFGLDVHTGTIESANYPDNYFDVIYSNATLEHLQHPLSTLKECARVLKPGGVLYASTVNWDSYTRKILGTNWRLIHPRHHIHLFTPENILNLCRYAGLEHVKTWTTGVRVKANTAGSKFHTPWYLNLMKGPLSAAARFTQKGDQISVLATKP